MVMLLIFSVVSVKFMVIWWLVKVLIEVFIVWFVSEGLECMIKLLFVLCVKLLWILLRLSEMVWIWLYFLMCRLVMLMKCIGVLLKVVRIVMVGMVFCICELLILVGRWGNCVMILWVLVFGWVNLLVGVLILMVLLVKSLVF